MTFEKKINPQIVQNMKIHYSELLEKGTKSFGRDFLSKSIFVAVDIDGDGKLSSSEVKKAKKNLDEYILKSIEKDDFYAYLSFGKSYTEALKGTDAKSKKSKSAQIMENNLNNAIEKIITYAKEHPEDSEFQKYSTKLKELVSNGSVQLTNIEEDGILGKFKKDSDTGEERILINSKHISTLIPQNVLRTLLHELRHSLDNDAIDSKAEELEAETSARKYAQLIDSTPTFDNTLNEFLKGYTGYAEASPGTYNIPPNAGIAIWYKPKEVSMKDNVLVIKSDNQENLKNGYIEDTVIFGDEKDSEGKPFPTSAFRKVYDQEGNVIFSTDFGEYDKNNRKFNYSKVKIEQIKFEETLNQNSRFKFGGLA